MGKLERMLTAKWSLHIQEIELEKAMTFRFGNDETLRTRTMAILFVGIAGVNGVLRVYVVPGGAPLLLFLENLLDRGHLFFEKVVSAGSGDKQTVTALAPPTDKFWSARTT